MVLKVVFEGSWVVLVKGNNILSPSLRILSPLKNCKVLHYRNLLSQVFSKPAAHICTQLYEDGSLPGKRRKREEWPKIKV